MFFEGERSSDETLYFKIIIVIVNGKAVYMKHSVLSMSHTSTGHAG